MNNFNLKSVFWILLLSLLFLIINAKSDVLSERENSGNGLEIREEPEINSGSKGRSFPNSIKDCIQTCRRLLFRGDRDLNYCIEGCRIRIYRKIYECVFEECNEKGNGIPTKFSREQYHQCVYLCKVKPKIKPLKPTKATTVSTTTTTTTIRPTNVTKNGIKDMPKLHFIPLEYHYFSDKKKKEKLNKNSLN